MWSADKSIWWHDGYHADLVETPSLIFGHKQMMLTMAVLLHLYVERNLFPFHSTCKTDVET